MAWVPDESSKIGNPERNHDLYVRRIVAAQNGHPKMQFYGLNIWKYKLALNRRKWLIHGNKWTAKNHRIIQIIDTNNASSKNCLKCIWTWINSTQKIPATLWKYSPVYTKITWVESINNILNLGFDNRLLSNHEICISKYIHTWNECRFIDRASHS